MSDCKKVVDFNSEAQETGARRGKARDLIGINFRTMKRWSRDLRDDGRFNNKIHCSNALSGEEERSCCCYDLLTGLL